MLKIATKLALKVSRTGWFILWVKFAYILITV